MIQEFLKSLESDPELIFIIIEALIGTFMAFMAVLSFTRSHTTYLLFFIITALLLYINMCLRIFDQIHFFSIRELKIFQVAIYQKIIDILPLLTLSLAFLFLNKK